MHEYPRWLRDLFPFTPGYAAVTGRNMAYIDVGPRDGRPVLLLSGNPTWGFLYRSFFGPLTDAGYRAIAPDWIGTGYSDHPRVDTALTFAHHIADLVAFIDALSLDQLVIVGQDWGGPQGLGACLRRPGVASALVLMSTWAYTGSVSRFHSSPRPWTTWHAPLIGQFFMKRLKVLSHHGPSAISKRGMTGDEARAYHHVYDEPDSDHVVLTWPRLIPMVEGDRGWADMALVESGLPSFRDTPTLLLWGEQDSVFGKPAADRLRELLPHAEGPYEIKGADHFMQDDRGPEIARRIVEFLDRVCGASVSGVRRAVNADRSSPPAEGWALRLALRPSSDPSTRRADPLLVEQELDVRPEVARTLERACGIRSGRTYWKSRHGHEYALELADLGRGYPSMATVYGLWERWEPRPPESEIDGDLLDLCLWVANTAPGIEPDDVVRVAARAGLDTPHLQQS